jgi:hypothetical protein
LGRPLQSGITEITPDHVRNFSVSSNTLILFSFCSSVSQIHQGMPKTLTSGLTSFVGWLWMIVQSQLQQRW